jgi:transposase
MTSRLCSPRRPSFMRFSRAFDAVFHSDGTRVVRTPVRAPNANAHVERWIGSVRRECLDRLLIFNRRQLERILRVYVRHYNELKDPGFLGGSEPGSVLGEGDAPPMAAPRKYSDELRERAVRLVFESGRPIAHVARDLGIHKEALRHWVRQTEADSGRRRDLLATEEREELKRLRKENAELRRANAILKDASVYFATELDPIRRR